MLIARDSIHVRVCRQPCLQRGHTSLSKVFGVIDRFSEDIDLSLSPTFLKLPGSGTSRNQANKWMAIAESTCEIAVQTQIGPALEVAAADVLGLFTYPLLASGVCQYLSSYP